MRTEQVDGLETRLVELESAGGGGNLLKSEIDISAGLASIESSAVDLIIPAAGEIAIPISFDLIAFDETPSNIGSIGNLFFHYVATADDFGQRIATIEAVSAGALVYVKATVNETKWTAGFPMGRPIRMSGDGNLSGGGTWKLIVTYLKITV